MKGCQRIVRLVSESCDRDLSRWESFSLNLHLNMCFYCRRYAASIGHLEVIMESYADIPEVQESSDATPDQEQDHDQEQETDGRADE